LQAAGQFDGWTEAVVPVDAAWMDERINITLPPRILALQADAHSHVMRKTAVAL